MPKREDIKKIMIIGSGPIVIGQACEFDYSGTQACKALRELGYEIVLVNSNPATIMTDPGMADATYVEPLNVERLAQIIDKERPDALLPNLGGQSGLNLSSELAKAGVLERYAVQIIGVELDAIERGEDRIIFKETMNRLGIEIPRSTAVYTVEEAEKVAADLGYPVVVRPAYTMGGTGGGLVYNVEELRTVASRGISASLIGQILIEESVLGWEELELEVVRDAKNQKITVCFIENVDAMGVHTGDSYCTAPMLTISKELQERLQDYSYRIVEAIEVIGGTNVQFAHDPRTDRIVVIEINPRTSRSSALASKATGFPIALVSAKLASGMTLDEIPYWQEGTLDKYTPSGDYVVVKFARWAFEKFRGAEDRLGTQMKAVGEAMAIGKTYKEALQKAIRSLEIGRYGLGFAKDFNEKPLAELLDMLKWPTSERQFIIYEALRKGAGVQEISDITSIKGWFIQEMKELVDLEEEILAYRGKGGELPDDLLERAKMDGFADGYLARLLAVCETDIRSRRKALGIVQGWHPVPVSGVEDAAYYYSTYNGPDVTKTTGRRKVMVLGGGPNRIGQGIEFDYCCVHAAFALRDLGYETIMVNCNPETVSTDYDTSDKLYFEPLTLEDVLNICDKEDPSGVIVQFGGQTPLNLAQPLQRHNVPIIGTTPDSIARAEDRKLFKNTLDKLGLHQPENDTATSVEEAIDKAESIGYPVVVRPSFVLGGRAMEIVYSRGMLERYMSLAVEASPEHPILIDKFLDDAVEVDVDAISDGERCVIGGIMEHIEEAGVHSGDSACVLPAFSLAESEIDQISSQTKALAAELGVRGLINVQYAIKNERLHVLEVNPRASRTVPFVSKAIGVPLAKLAALVMAGAKLSDLGFTEEIHPPHTAVKCPVFPFAKFSGFDPLLGPEMKSTGEVMGVDSDFGAAFAKAYIAAGHDLPTRGTIFLSVRNRDKRDVIFLAKRLHELGFKIVATGGTAGVLRRVGVEAEEVYRVSDPRGRNVIDLIRDGRIQLIINTPTAGEDPREDQKAIRAAAVLYGIPAITTISGAMVAVMGLESLIKGRLSVKPLQEYHEVMRAGAGTA